MPKNGLICLHFILKKGFCELLPLATLVLLYQITLCNSSQIYGQIMLKKKQKKKNSGFIVRSEIWVPLIFGAAVWSNQTVSKSLLGTSAGQKEEVTWQWQESLPWIYPLSCAAHLRLSSISGCNYVGILSSRWLYYFYFYFFGTVV